MNKYLYYNNIQIGIGKNDGETTHYQDIVSFQGSNNETLKTAIQKFTNSNNTHNLFIETNNIETAFEWLKSEFKYIVAAGGLIQKNDKYLFIKRLGKWDLPKGKLDEGESIEHAAVRECEEECAVSGLSIIKPLPDTYHIYEFKKGYALKTTHWFHMQTDFDKELKPQTEENIEEAVWMDVDQIRNVVLKNTYITIEKLVVNFFKL